MLHHGHFRDQIGDLQKLVLGVAAGHDDVLVLRLVAQDGQHFLQREVIVAQHDVEFVQQNHLDRGVADQGDGLIPGGAGGGDIALAALSFPGEAFAHGVDRDLIGEALKHYPLPGFPLPLDELDDPDLEAMPYRPHHHAERRCGLALALAGMDDQKPLLQGLGRDHPVARRLLLRHLFGVTGVDLVFGHAFGLHGVSPRASLSSISYAALDLGRQRPRDSASASRSAISRNAAGLAPAMKFRTSSSATYASKTASKWWSRTHRAVAAKANM